MKEGIPTTHDTGSKETGSKQEVTRRGFLKRALGLAAGAAAVNVLGTEKAEAGSCGEGANTYYGREYCNRITRGKEPELTPENLQMWSYEHDCLSNYVQSGKMEGRTCARGSSKLEKYLTGNGKLTKDGCIYFEWLDRRWDRAYRKGISGIPQPPWHNENLPNRQQYSGS